MIFRLLFFALLATAMGQSVVMTTLPSLGRAANLTEFQVATIMSSSALMYALGNTVWSRFAKRHGHRRILMIGLAGSTIGTLIFASVWLSGFYALLTGSGLFLALLFSRASQACVMSATPPSAVGLAIAISSPHERVKSISKVSSANNLGQILGPTFAGLTVGFGLLTPLYSITLITLIALAMIWRYLPRTESSPPPSIGPKDDKAPSPLNHSVTMLILMNAGVFCTIAMMQQSLGFFLIDHHGATPVEAAQGVGLAMMISAMSALSVQVSVVQRTAIPAERLVQIAIPLLSVAFLIIYIHQYESSLYLAMSLLGCGMGMSYPAIAALATTSCKPENQATVTGMITASPAMGYVVGPPIAAALYNYGHRLPFLSASIMLGLLSLVAFLVIRKRPNK